MSRIKLNAFQPQKCKVCSLKFIMIYDIDYNYNYVKGTCLVWMKGYLYPLYEAMWWENTGIEHPYAQLLLEQADISNLQM